MQPTQPAATDKPGDAAPDNNAALDLLQAEAEGMTSPPLDAAQIEQPAQLFPDSHYEATHEMIVGGIKTALKGQRNGELAGKVWDSELFKGAVIPVLKKYNITMTSLPVELVLIGVVFMLAKQTVAVIKAEKNDDKAPQPA